MPSKVLFLIPYDNENLEITMDRFLHRLPVP